MKITNDLLNNSHIIFESNIKNQIEALTKITDLTFSLGYITNRDELLKAFLALEQELSTGFEGGIAIPHARIKSIKKPAILILCNNNGVDWKAIDGQLTTFIIALIIPETQAENLHLDILSTLAIKLVNKDFRKKLKNAKNSQEIISLINDETVKNSTKKEIKTMKNKETKKIVGVSSFNYVEKYGWPKIIHQFTLKILFLIKNLLKVTLFSVKIL
ncbi:fructose PTS transporter subunit IIA [Spiroplasma endosymbiont of Amphimallon solstitiale]|uniref:PTS sugar transporter subunit IIA n=1 Tax=Spiroplasma endosymbiont of Amphimallon solstitiale TaxID=3066288 RepID=UPI00313F2466